MKIKTLILALSLFSLMPASAKLRKVRQTVSFNGLAPIILTARAKNIITVTNIDPGIRRLRVKTNGQTRIRRINKKANVKNGTAKVKLRTKKSKTGEPLNEIFALFAFDSDKDNVENKALKLMLPDGSNCITEFAPVCATVNFDGCESTKNKICNGDESSPENLTFNNECIMNSFGAIKVNDGPCL